MKDVLVELRQIGKPPVVMALETYLDLRQRLPEDLVEDGPAHIVHDCHHCKTRHELGTFEEWVALMMRGAAREFSDSCVVNKVRGGQ